jgi:hypothetical protein
MKTLLLVANCFLFAAYTASCLSPAPTTENRAASAGRAAATPEDDAISRAFAKRAGGVQVGGAGTVTRLLSDDVSGSRHQRFIVRLASGRTVLVAHNIDIAPRIEGLKVGDAVSFNGEYEWNEEGGVIHWTHRDPQGRHVAGWVEHKGRTFQ